MAKYYGDRVSTFNTNQIAFNAINDTYTIDENEDGTTDYSIGNPNFSEVFFNSNLVVRWEYIPGSEIFLVWSQGIFGQGNSKDDLFTGINDAIFGRKPENIFLIKATYRFLF